MPAGVSWGEYLRFVAAAMISTIAGAQTVHYYYKPLEDFKRLYDCELERRRTSVQT